MPTMHPSRSRALGGSAGTVPPVPVVVIPLDNPEALVDAAVTSHSHSYCGIATRRQAMRAALAAIGVLPKSKGGRK